HYKISISNVSRHVNKIVETIPKKYAMHSTSSWSYSYHSKCLYMRFSLSKPCKSLIVISFNKV
ncbi:hypothetical protein NYT90_16205, partial [Staphylococcus aureus]|uniref:hypothetical protein n=1 Tax=Staphylococcus aureus TaxID=1280 RepID=UPI0021759A53